VVDKDRIIDGQSIRSGDRLIGLASSGIHANGYSLVRRIIELDPAARQPARPDGPAIEALLAPTRIYARAVAELTRQVPVRGLCHITGGGLTENLPRVLPHGVDARIDTHTWEWPEVFAWLQQTGGVNTAEMRRTFNCGVGMVAVVPAAEADRAVRCLEAAGETAWVIGEVVPQTGTQPAVQYQGGE
jgi:phosphoribosylformylglycinamidine cyclo-ligase